MGEYTLIIESLATGLKTALKAMVLRHNYILVLLFNLLLYI